MATVSTINGVVHAKQVLADAGVKMPFDKGYQAWQEAREKAAADESAPKAETKAKPETK